MTAINCIPSPSIAFIHNLGTHAKVELRTGSTFWHPILEIKKIMNRWDSKYR